MADPAHPPDRALRASDADREKVADELRMHSVDGRITLDELDQRLHRVMSARTIGELAELVRDLPTTGSKAVTSASRPQVGRPGIRPFIRRLVVPATVRRTREIALDTLAPGLNRGGYELVSQSASGLIFERGPGRRRGKRQRIVISLEARSTTSTDMTIHGTASRATRKAFAQLTF